ncbi:MAG: ATP-binding cassette domain-containing protein [Elusimicrobiota bacterium]
MITVRELSKRFGATVAVDRISFEVGRGEVLGFLGPNGAGKTTTLRMLSGYLPPTGGTAELGGRDVVEAGLEVRRRIGYLPENNPLYEEMDVCEYLEWTAEIRGFSGQARTNRIRSAVEACGLGEVLGRPIGLLSKGYRQRAGLAAAILHDPDILLLDEPTSGLDPNQAREVRDLILKLKEAKTVVLSTHILPEVQASCDRVVIIHRGRIAASGTPKELKRAASGLGLIHLSLKASDVDLASARETLETVPGVERSDASEEDGELRFSLTCRPEAGDLRETFFRIAVEKSWTLLHLNREEASLEHVFRELTLK